MSSIYICPLCGTNMLYDRMIPAANKDGAFYIYKCRSDADETIVHIDTAGNKSIEQRSLFSWMNAN